MLIYFYYLHLLSQSIDIHIRNKTFDFKSVSSAVLLLKVLPHFTRHELLHCEGPCNEQRNKYRVNENFLQLRIE